MTHATTRRDCHRYLRAAAGVALVCALARAVAADETSAAPMPRVRSDNPEIAALIQRGTERSTTFRRMVATIDGTDGIVYVQEGKCGHSVHACLLLSITVAGPHRILRVLINTGQPEREVLSAIGHELWHAIEVLRQPGLRTYPAVYSFFDREGPTGSERFETPAAVRAGLDVRTELGGRK